MEIKQAYKRKDGTYVVAGEADRLTEIEAQVVALREELNTLA
jgi:hypothetical protein